MAPLKIKDNSLRYFKQGAKGIGDNMKPLKHGYNNSDIVLYTYIRIYQLLQHHFRLLYLTQAVPTDLELHGLTRTLALIVVLQ
jgi:hypothetical protein